MGFLSDFRYRHISQTATVDALLKQAFRKSIHFGAALVPLAARFNFSLPVSALALALLAYVYCEYRRLHGETVPIVSRITAIAARKRDEGRFVLGPVTLCLGILLTMLIFPLADAGLCICALAYGDGIASLAGKLFGRRRIPHAAGKTLEGSTACFLAVFLAILLCTRSPGLAFVLAVVSAAIEMLPLKDYDNLLIPFAIAGISFSLRF